MNQPEVERRWTSIRINEVSHTTDRQGRPQYKLSVHFEWTPHSNTWGDNLYVYKDQCPEVLEAGTHNVLVERGTVKKKSDNAGGGYHDGTQDWMYRWRIVEWESTLNIDNVGQSSAWGGNQAPVTPIPTPTVQEIPQTPVSTPQTPYVPTQAPVARAIDENQMRIMRQATLKCASWMMVPLMKDFSNPLLAVQRTEELSEMFMEYVISGNIKVADETPDLSSLEEEVDF